MMGRSLALFLGLGLLWGCSYRMDLAGDDSFLYREIAWEAGTTAQDVARALGPPDAIQRRGAEMWFIYRYRQSREATFLVSYFVRVFSRETERQIESILVVAFDQDDRLLFHGISHDGLEPAVPILGF